MHLLASAIWYMLLPVIGVCFALAWWHSSLSEWGAQWHRDLHGRRSAFWGATSCVLLVIFILILAIAPAKAASCQTLDQATAYIKRIQPDAQRSEIPDVTRYLVIWGLAKQPELMHWPDAGYAFISKKHSHVWLIFLLKGCTIGQGNDSIKTHLAVLSQMEGI